MKQRESNLELLRIVSMFLIVFHHFAIHGSSWASQYHPAFKGAEEIQLLLLCLGKVGVVAFVLIGAYFLSVKQFKLWRIINLCTITFVYSWLIYLVLLLCYPQVLKMESLQFTFLPIPIPSNYWFVIAYVYMLILMPFLNLVLQKLSNRQLVCLLGLIFLFWCCLQFIPNNKLDNTDYSFFNENNYFLFLYLIGGFIRKNQLVARPNKAFTYLIGSIIITYLIIILSVNSKNYAFLESFMVAENNPISLIIGILMFLYFNSLKLGHIKAINYVSKSMFGVYLIHDNSFIRYILWNKIINTAPLARHVWGYLFGGLFVSIAIFMICIAIDLLKRKFIDPLVMGRVHRWTDRFLNWS